MASDFLHECLSDPALAEAAKQGPEAFRQAACAICRNYECVRSSPLSPDKNPWLERILTQEERLLTNPRFADDRDPQFAQIRMAEFRNALREAIDIELSTAKGDWSVPTDADRRQYISGMAAGGVPNLGAPKPMFDEVKVVPVGEDGRPEQPPQPVPPPAPSAPTPPVQAAPPEPEPIEVEVKIERAKTGRSTCRQCGSKITIGQPRFGRFDMDALVGKPVWQWFHVPCGEQTFPEEVARAQSPAPAPAPAPRTAPPAPRTAPTPPPQAPEGQVPASRSTAPVVGPDARTFTPKVANTPAPRGGVTLGGPPTPSAPAPDPWAAPNAPGQSRSTRTVKPGATIRMGGDEEK